MLRTRAQTRGQATLNQQIQTLQSAPHTYSPARQHSIRRVRCGPPLFTAHRPSAHAALLPHFPGLLPACTQTPMQSFGKAYTVIDCTVTVDTHEAGRSVPDAATSEASSLPVRPLLTGRITACLRVCRSSVHPPTGIIIPITQISDRNRIQNGCNAFIRCSSSSAVFPFW